MAIIYDASVKTARMDATKAAVGTNGKLKILDASNVVLAVLDLGAGGSVSGSVWTLIASPVSDLTADAGGTPSKAIITTSADATKVSGLTVGLTGADINLDSLSITAGQEVKINSATITHAA